MAPDVPPQKPNNPDMIKYLRFIDPDDPTKLIQLALTDTGTLTQDGIKKYALSTVVSGGGGGGGTGVLVSGIDNTLTQVPLQITQSKQSLKTILHSIWHRWFKSPPGVYLDEELQFRATSRVIDPRGLDSVGGYELALPVAIAGRAIGLVDETSFALLMGEQIQSSEIDCRFCEEIVGGIRSDCTDWELELWCISGTLTGGYNITYYEKITGALPGGATDEIIPIYFKPNGSTFFITFKNIGTTDVVNQTYSILRRA